MSHFASVEIRGYEISPANLPRKIMSKLSVALHNDLKLLELLRDELALQAHLLKADVKTRWQEMESKWSVLKEHIGRAQVAGDDARQETESAIGLLSDSLRKGYAGIRDALKGS